MMKFYLKLLVCVNYLISLNKYTSLINFIEVCCPFVKQSSNAFFFKTGIIYSLKKYIFSQDDILT